MTKKKRECPPASQHESLDLENWRTWTGNRVQERPTRSAASRPAGSPYARYCSDACWQRAYRQRKRKTALQAQA